MRAWIWVLAFFTLLPGEGWSADDEGLSDRAAIQKTIRDHLPQIRSCYEKLLPSNPELEGKLVLAWSVGAGGKVLKATVKENKVVGYASGQLATCLLGVIKEIRFPAPPPNGVFEIEGYPFQFSR